VGLLFEYEVGLARSKAGRHIRVVDGFVGTITDAGLASLARLCMIDARMAMLEKDHFPKDTVRT
jgi:hypothetical protein